MNTTVLVALIASLASVFIAVGNIYWTARQKKEERQATVRAELDRYRQPLLSAVYEIGNRIDIIRNHGFFFYLGMEDRHEQALLSTLFRFAQYFAWTEILYGHSGYLLFAANKDTRAISDTLGWIASTLADDRYDRMVPGDFTTSQLMIWREEQRAIGELMRQGSNVPACVGYSSFVNNYEDHYAKWFATFASQLERTFSPQRTEKTHGSQMLDQLQGLMAKLFVELDTGKALTEFGADGKVTKPRWAQPGRYPRLRSVDEVISQRNSAARPGPTT
jgi:hypothetical protein